MVDLWDIVCHHQSVVARFMGKCHFTFGSHQLGHRIMVYGQEIDILCLFFIFDGDS